MADNEHENAVKYLADAKEFAEKRDSYNINSECRYTCTMLDHVEDDISCKLSPTFSIDYWNQSVGQTIFAPVRDRMNFKALLD